MAAIRAEREQLNADDCREVKIAVEVRKQCTATRWLPFQTIAKLCAVDTHQEKAALTDKMLPGCFDDLFGARKVNEAVMAIDFRAAKYARALGRSPQRGRANFIDCRHCGAN